jgi:hypothetical protein
MLLEPQVEVIRVGLAHDPTIADRTKPVKPPRTILDRMEAPLPYWWRDQTSKTVRHVRSKAPSPQRHGAPPQILLASSVSATCLRIGEGRMSKVAWYFAGVLTPFLLAVGYGVYLYLGLPKSKAWPK